MTGVYVSEDTLEASVESAVVPLEKGGHGGIYPPTPVLRLKAASGVLITGTSDLQYQWPTGLQRPEKSLRQRNAGAAGMGCRHHSLS